LEAEREVAVWDKDAMAGVMFIREARAIDVSHSCRQKCWISYVGCKFATMEKLQILR
jgi:hypothetical protein